MNPNDPYTSDDQTRFTMRISTDLLDKVKLEAAKHKRSTAKELEFIIEQYLSGRSKEKT